MTEKLKFDLVTPEKLFLSEEVEMVTVPGTEGDFGVLVNHAPFMSTIRPGVIEVTREGSGGPMRIFVDGGFAEVTPIGLTVLAEQALPVEQVDKAKLDQDIQDLEEDERDAKDDDVRRKAAERLGQLRALRANL